MKKKKGGRAYTVVYSVGVDEVSQEVAAPQEESLSHHVGYEAAVNTRDKAQTAGVQRPTLTTTSQKNVTFTSVTHT